MVHFYTSIIESVLAVVRCAEEVMGCNLLSLRDPHASRTPMRAGKMTVDPSHPRDKRFVTLASGEELQSVKNQNLTPREQLLLSHSRPR